MPQHDNEGRGRAEGRFQVQAMQAGQSGRWLMLLAGLLAAILLPWALFGDELARQAMAAAAALVDRPWLVMALVALLLALDPVLPVPSSIVAVASGSALGAGVGAAAIFSGLMAGALIGNALLHGSLLHAGWQKFILLGNDALWRWGCGLVSRHGCGLSHEW